MTNTEKHGKRVMQSDVNRAKKTIHNDYKNAIGKKN